MFFNNKATTELYALSLHDALPISTSINIKIGVKKDGRITAATADLRYQDGAFPGIWAMLGAMTSYACYDLKNVKTVGYDVLVNRPKVTAYRAPSAPMAAFAVESTLDRSEEHTPEPQSQA